MPLVGNTIHFSQAGIFLLYNSIDPGGRPEFLLSHSHSTTFPGGCCLLLLLRWWYTLHVLTLLSGI